MKKKIWQRTAVLVGIIIVLMTFLHISKGYSLPHFHGETYFEQQWQLSVDGGKAKSITLPAPLKYDGEHKYSISSKIKYKPLDDESPYAFLTMNHMYFKVYLDNEEIYSYTASDTPNFSKSPGNSYPMIPLPHNCYGKEIRIDFWLTLDGGVTYVLSEVEFGNYETVMHRNFMDDLFHNITVIGIILTGIILALISTVQLKSKASKEGFCISIFAIIFGIYGLTESLFYLYMLSNPYFAYLINFLFFAATPIPLMHFFKGKMVPDFYKYYNIIIGGLYLNIIVQLVLHFSKIMDLRQMLFATHMLYLFAIVLVAYSLSKTPLEYYKGKYKLLFCLIPILIGMVIDAFFYYFIIEEKTSNAAFMQVGVLFFLIMQFIYVLKSILKTYRKSVKSEFYKNLAYRDGLTGLYNRASYNIEKDELKKNREGYSQLTCLCADINGLKEINDIYGHQTGDLIICKAANYLLKHFREYGKVFRTGGDEFVIFLYDITEEALYETIRIMYDDVNHSNKKEEVKLYFAIGVATTDDINRYSVEEIIIKADKEMYTQKMKFKERS